MKPPPIDYNEPPVLVGGPVPINGKWVNGRAEFPQFRSGILTDVHAWVWTTDGRAVRVDIDMGDHLAVVPGTEVTVTDIRLWDSR